MSMRPFITPERVYFGSGSLESLPPVLKEFGAKRVLVVTDKGVAASGAVDLLVGHLDQQSIAAAVFDGTKPEPGEETVADVVGWASRGEHVDAVVGLGGGSPMDVAKVAAIIIEQGGALRDYLGQDKIQKPGLPLVLVPTTAGTGAEATPNALFVVDGEKQAVISRYLIPRVAIIDPDLTLSLPPRVTAASGVDALVHAYETYTSVAATPLSEMYSLRAVGLIASSIRTAVWQGSDKKARTDMALGSFLAGVAIANAGTGAVHALAYPLGGKYRIPHGVANSLMFPYVAEWNAVANMSKFAMLARAMGEQVEGLSLREAALSFVKSVKAVIQDLGLPQTLQELGVALSDLDHLVDSAARQTRLLKNNPRNLSRDDIAAIYRNAMGSQGNA